MIFVINRYTTMGVLESILSEPCWKFYIDLPDSLAKRKLEQVLDTVTREQLMTVGKKCYREGFTSGGAVPDYPITSYEFERYTQGVHNANKLLRRKDL